MKDIYIEHLIKRKTPVKEKLFLLFVIGVTAGVLFFSIMNPLLMVLAVVMIAVDVFLFRSMDVEFEYLYINGSLDIDKIMSKSRRKSVFGMDLNELEIMAPLGAPELRPYQGLKTTDYSSGMQNHRIYEMILGMNGVKRRILIEPSEELVEGMWIRAPRKVIK